MVVFHLHMFFRTLYWISFFFFSFSVQINKHVIFIFFIKYSSSQRAHFVQFMELVCRSWVQQTDDLLLNCYSTVKRIVCSCNSRVKKIVRRAISIFFKSMVLAKKSVGSRCPIWTYFIYTKHGIQITFCKNNPIPKLLRLNKTRP